jgi:diguanylate cyclase (GGDEF)-like protein/PAS domain S-box-containing protein
LDRFDLPSLSRGLLDAAPDPIVIVDDRGHIVLVNDLTVLVFGFARTELLGQPVEILIPERFRDRHGHHRANYHQQPQVRPMGAATAQFSGRRKDGSEFPVDVSLSPFRAPQGQFVISIIRDVSHRVVIEQRLRHQSTHDALTGLYNRAYFDEELARLDRGRWPVAIVVADVDGLKRVNDTLGHASGDLLLQKAAAILSSAFRAEDVVARIGGDEFAALAPGIEDGNLVPILERLRRSTESPPADGEALPVSLSVGVSIGNPGQLVETLRAADAAMYAEKRTRLITVSADLPVIGVTAR